MVGGLVSLCLHPPVQRMLRAERELPDPWFLPAGRRRADWITAFPAVQGTEWRTRFTQPDGLWISIAEKSGSREDQRRGEAAGISHHVAGVNVVPFGLLCREAPTPSLLTTALVLITSNHTAGVVDNPSCLSLRDTVHNPPPPAHAQPGATMCLLPLVPWAMIIGATGCSSMPPAQVEVFSYWLESIKSGRDFFFKWKWSRKWKVNLWNGRKYLHMTYLIISPIHKEVIPLNRRKTSHSIKKKIGKRSWIDIFPKRIYKWPTERWIDGQCY